MGFVEMSVRISPNTPSLPDMVAATYEVCGQIDLSQLPASMTAKGQPARQVIFMPNGLAKDAQEPILLSADTSGAFCTLLTPGSYKLQPMSLESEVADGLK